MSFLAYFFENIEEVLLRTGEHLQITVSSVSIAVLIGVPLGLLLVHFQRIAPLVQYFLSVMQTIPSLALLGFLIPIAGIGFKPSVIALVIYSLLVIVQNTIVGIKQIDPAIVESATGVGMTKWQVLFKVQIPLALPVITTGIRVATVTCVGIATLVAAIGAGALGTFIFRGINILDTNLILLGAVPSALLAVILDTILIVLGKWLDRN
ncbi:ABC transporter permease [Candidatus Haliotispira prima]|uniref:ABC transporter permease n=1 Tax=Candidatus Haliotispira prima TaxID=3034016 RepID=A0ABY8MJW3_9SPIO|nr:ABC transporter permease [Candidatus Haliotispira prima]